MLPAAGAAAVYDMQRLQSCENGLQQWIHWFCTGFKPPSRHQLSKLTKFDCRFSQKALDRLPLSPFAFCQAPGMQSWGLQRSAPSHLPAHQITSNPASLAPKAAKVNFLAPSRRKAVMVAASRQQQKSQGPWGVRAAAVVTGLALLITL
jgi:hypothetical protein